MTLTGLIVLILLVGFGLWFVETHVPMNKYVKALLVFVVVVALILIIARAFGFSDLAVPQVLP